MKHFDGGALVSLTEDPMNLLPGAGLLCNFNKKFEQLLVGCMIDRLTFLLKEYRMTASIVFETKETPHQSPSLRSSGSSQRVKGLNGLNGLKGMKGERRE